MANQRPDAVRRAALELLGRGLSEREVIKALTNQGMRASRGSIQNWRRSAEGPDAPRTPAAPAPAPSARPAPTAPTVAASAAPESPVDDTELTDEDLLRLPEQELAKMMVKVRERFIQETESPALDHTVLGALTRDQERLAKALVLARPPVKLDPAKDPASIEARREVFAKIDRLVAKEQASAEQRGA